MMRYSELLLKDRPLLVHGTRLSGKPGPDRTVESHGARGLRCREVGQSGPSGSQSVACESATRSAECSVQCWKATVFAVDVMVS